MLRTCPVCHECYPKDLVTIKATLDNAPVYICDACADGYSLNEPTILNEDL